MTTSPVSRARPERSGTGITLRAFRLNTAINHIMFTGRRGRVYDRLVVLTADLAPLLHLRLRGLLPDAAGADPLADLAEAAGFQIESWGKVPLLRYVVATRPRA